jgi:hypothetical protein
MMLGPVWMLFAFVAVILLIFLLSGGTRRTERRGGSRTVCDRCATEQPYNAQFCGRCGQKLE